ncbi:hypothetical protein H6F67_00190 [Microcoleus sp. FACHB-1515]|uniref:hypothetical protein n=1 Tax=Cyanophyceae TaxID=3028117 RepID=UPI00168943B1|nr:hypothetical protein [Microcoleus sp. FACHB-1515]MBD2088294.1 hypothetical protein [Microcoleus sp. FACHB-1515]
MANAPSDPSQLQATQSIAIREIEFEISPIHATLARCRSQSRWRPLLKSDAIAVCEI